MPNPHCQRCHVSDFTILKLGPYRAVWVCGCGWVGPPVAALGDLCICCWTRLADDELVYCNACRQTNSVAASPWYTEALELPDNAVVVVGRCKLTKVQALELLQALEAALHGD